MFAASVLALLGLFATYAWQSYDRVFGEAEDRLRRRASVLSAHVARVFDNQAAAIDLAIHKLEGRGAVGGDLSRWLADRARQDPAVAAMLAIGTDGVVLASSRPADGIRFDDREQFKAALASGGVVVGERVAGRLADESVFTLSRRWSGGVVAVGLMARTFEHVFTDSLAEDRGEGIVGLYRADGSPLAQAPAAAQPLRLSPSPPAPMPPIGQAREGAYRPEVGGERLYAFHQVDGYPVWLVNGMNAAHIRGMWLRGLVPYGVLSLLAVSLLSVAMAVAARRERELADFEAQLSRAVAERGAEARDALAAAERAHLAKSHFLAAASHDLRQPIQGLRLFLDVLDGRLRDPYNRQILGSAVEALEGAEGLLSTFLDVSTLEAGMIPVRRRAVPLADLLEQLGAEFVPAAAARGLMLTVVPCRHRVDSDPILLARMLRNLLANAIRYTGTGRILLGCRHRGDMVSIEVWDTGQGIPGDKLEAVFEDFVQVGNPERDRAKGLGLGLAVVRRMAAMLGHEVAVRSLLGRGTVFAIRLPVVTAPATNMDAHSLR